jgi:glucose/arabinose dehydrogenase
LKEEIFMHKSISWSLTVFAAASFASGFLFSANAQTGATLTGQDAFTDYSKEAPGIRRHITAADLPKPFATESSNNGPHVVAKPANAWPKAPAGFKVELYTQGDFKVNRLIRFAPNGDLFLADSGDNSIIVLRGVGADGKVKQRETFATGLNEPFGINFYPAQNPKWVYVGNTDSVVRFPYKAGDLKATGPAETIVAELPHGGGHITRDIAFSPDGKRMFVSVGSSSNVDDVDTHPAEFHRADVLEFTPEGKFVKVYASGIRNCVGETINPTTGQLWCSTNERDGLGDNLVPDYVTSVKEDGFYGWPFYYIGNHPDPRHNGKHPELASKVIAPDVLLQPHFASLELTFYPTQGGQFPAGFQGDGFAAEHGSWNKSKRAGYEVVRIPMKNGHATGEFEDFLTGFTTADGQVWGRPVGVAVAKDGSLFVSDDGSKSVWHVTYTGK